MNNEKALKKYRDEANFINDRYGLGDEDHDTALDRGHIYDLMRKFAEQKVKLILPVVSDRRELLIAFCDWYNKEIPDYLEKSDKTIDRYLSNL